MKILVISQHLFPMQTPRAHRTTELVRELGKQGHKVTLYAVIGKHDYSSFEQETRVKVKPIPIRWMVHPYNSDNDGIRTLPDKILGKTLKKLEFPNLEFMYRVPEILKKDHDYDALISIADPHQIHWGLARYRKKHQHSFPKVWIADCGDPFMLNGARKGRLKLFERMERLFCEQCDAITVPVEEAKKGYYSEYRNKIKVIPQGFVFELPGDTKEPQNAMPIFAYAGTFYKDIRNPEKFMNYLASLKSEFRFVVYTDHSALIDQYMQLLGDKLEIRKPIPRTELINELKTMDFLVNIENVNSPAQIPSKLIDYAITGRPILSVDPVQLNTNVVNEFLSKDYSHQLVIPNLEQYQIENVSKKFITLIEEYSR
jgi:hypothetical protein